MQNSIVITRKRFDRVMNNDPMYLADEACDELTVQQVKDHVWSLLYNELNSDNGLDNAIDAIVNSHSVV